MRHVPGRAGPDDRLDRAADDRRRPQRRLPHRLGDHRLPARLDRVHPALGQARRPVRPEDLLPGLDRHLPGRLDPVRPVQLDDHADRVPRGAGPRLRRPDGRRAGDRGRHRLAPRPGQVLRPLRRRLRGRQRDRPAARRRLRGRAVLALDLLHQHPDRRDRAVRGGQPGAGQAQPDPPPDRLPRHDRALPRRDRADPADQPGRHHLPVGVGPDLHPRRGRRGADHRVRLRRAPGARAGAPAAPVQDPGLLRHQRRRLHRRLRHVRRDRLPARLLPGRPRHLAHHLRALPAAADGRAADHVDHLRAGHLARPASTGTSRSRAPR